MRDQATPIDPQIYARTAHLFDQKRRVLPADALEGFAREVVARVAETAAARAPSGRTRVSPARVSAFCDLLLQPDQPRRALAFILARRDEGATIEDVYLGYIGAAARLLGERWEADALTPLQVTIGAGTLYALMRALRGSLVVRQPQDPQRVALFASVPGEKHGIGVTVAADMFREAGWDIDLQLGLDQSLLREHVARTQPTVIGLSLSTGERLPQLIRTVVGLRLAAPDAVIGIAPGGELTGTDIQDIVDVDLIFGDAASAIMALERWVTQGHRPDPAG